MMRSAPLVSAVLLAAAACAGRGEGPAPALESSAATEDDAVAGGHADVR